MREDTLVLLIEGSDLGVVIGRRGETLDSLQVLTGLAANRGEGEYVRVNLDSGNFREKRTRPGRTGCEDGKECGPYRTQHHSGAHEPL